MTAAAMVKKLNAAMKKHGPRIRVTIDLREDICRDGLSHWEVNCFDVETIRWRGDDDSFELKDGTERTRTVVSIS